jgi:hypothetical protein
MTFVHTFKLLWKSGSCSKFPTPYLRQSGLYLISDMMQRDCSDVTPNTLKFLWLTIRSCSTHTNTLQVTITILFTCCMDSPSEANSFAIIHKIPCMLWIKVYHFVHNSPLLASIQHQANAFHNIPCYFIKIHFNIILPSRPRSSKWSFSFTFPH